MVTHQVHISLETFEYLAAPALLPYTIFKIGCDLEPRIRNRTLPKKAGSRIQKQQQKRGVKKNFLSYLFYVATNFTKLKIILVLKCWRKKFGPQKYGFGIRDPGSGKNLFRIPDPGVKKVPDPGSGSATLPCELSNNFCVLSIRYKIIALPVQIK